MGFTTAFGPQFTYQPPPAVGHVVDARLKTWRCTCGKDFDHLHHTRLPAEVAAHSATLIGYPATPAPTPQLQAARTPDTPTQPQAPNTTIPDPDSDHHLAA